MVNCWRGLMKVLSPAIMKRKSRKFINHLQEIKLMMLVIGMMRIVMRLAPNPYDEEEEGWGEGVNRGGVGPHHLFIEIKL